MKKIVDSDESNHLHQTAFFCLNIGAYVGFIEIKCDELIAFFRMEIKLGEIEIRSCDSGTTTMDVTCDFDGR